MAMTPGEAGIVATGAAAITAILPKLVGYFLGGKRRETLHEITAHMDRLEKDNAQLREREDMHEGEIRRLWRRVVRLERTLINHDIPLPPEEEDEK